jgi:molybdopterin/thiamine biosynthesis adenylyltransferase
VNDDQELRYSRHLLLDEWGDAAQERLLQAHALVVGAGGLGAPALLYLAGAGVGHITVVDPDEVELSNLQRQVAHSTATVGLAKVASAQQAVQALNPEVRVTAVKHAADEAWLRDHVPQASVVLDCTDRFATRHLVNRVCRESGVPLVTASAVRWDGQISVFDPREPDGPCYACLFPPDVAPEEVRCALMGVFAPAVGVMGVMQAGEAIKLLARGPLGQGADPAWAVHRSLSGRLLMLDARTWRWTELRVGKHPQCPVCGSGAGAHWTPGPAACDLSSRG